MNPRLAGPAVRRACPTAQCCRTAFPSSFRGGLHITDRILLDPDLGLQGVPCITVERGFQAWLFPAGGTGSAYSRSGGSEPGYCRSGGSASEAERPP